MVKLDERKTTYEKGDHVLVKKTKKRTMIYKLRRVEGQNTLYMWFLIYKKDGTMTHVKVRKTLIEYYNPEV